MADGHVERKTTVWVMNEALNKNDSAFWAQLQDQYPNYYAQD